MCDTRVELYNIYKSTITPRRNTVIIYNILLDFNINNNIIVSYEFPLKN